MLCKIINKRGYNWALDHVRTTTFGQFKKLGEPLVFGKDKVPYNVAPLIPWNIIKSDNQGGIELLRFGHQCCRFQLIFSSGFHYCKLLSPAHTIDIVIVHETKQYNIVFPIYWLT